MKRNFISGMFVALGAMIFASCTVNDAVNPSFDGPRTVTLNAQIEQTTRTALTDHVLTWAEGDTYGVFAVDENGRHLGHFEVASTGKTSVTLPEGTAALYGYYPYNPEFPIADTNGDDLKNLDDDIMFTVYAQQEGFEFDPAKHFMAAKASVSGSEVTLSFKPLMTVVELNVYNSESAAKVYDISFSAEQGEVSGNFLVDWDNPSGLCFYESPSHGSQITVMGPDEGLAYGKSKAEGCKFMFCVPKGVYGNATIKVGTSEAGKGLYSDPYVFTFSELDFSNTDGKTFNINLSKAVVDEVSLAYPNQGTELVQLHKGDDAWAFADPEDTTTPVYMMTIVEGYTENSLILAGLPVLSWDGDKYVSYNVYGDHKWIRNDETAFTVLDGDLVKFNFDLSLFDVDFDFAVVDIYKADYSRVRLVIAPMFEAQTPAEQGPEIEFGSSISPDVATLAQILPSDDRYDQIIDQWTDDERVNVYEITLYENPGDDLILSFPNHNFNPPFEDMGYFPTIGSSDMWLNFTCLDEETGHNWLVSVDDEGRLADEFTSNNNQSVVRIVKDWYEEELVMILVFTFDYEKNGQGGGDEEEAYALSLADEAAAAAENTFLTKLDSNSPIFAQVNPGNGIPVYLLSIGSKDYTDASVTLKGVPAVNTGYAIMVPYQTEKTDWFDNFFAFTYDYYTQTAVLNVDFSNAKQNELGWLDLCTYDIYTDTYTPQVRLVVTPTYEIEDGGNSGEEGGNSGEEESVDAPFEITVPSEVAEISGISSGDIYDCIMDYYGYDFEEDMGKPYEIYKVTVHKSLADGLTLTFPEIEDLMPYGPDFPLVQVDYMVSDAIDGINDLVTASCASNAATLNFNTSLIEEGEFPYCIALQYLDVDTYMPCVSIIIEVVGW